jgi:hypothetical protein
MTTKSEQLNPLLRPKRVLGDVYRFLLSLPEGQAYEPVSKPFYKVPGKDIDEDQRTDKDQLAGQRGDLS